MADSQRRRRHGFKKRYGPSPGGQAGTVGCGLVYRWGRYMAI